MSDSTADFYHQKTDAELLFFVENPGYYQPELVESARRELKRRGVALPSAQAPHVATDTIIPNFDAVPARPGPNRGLLLLAVAALAVSLGVWYFVMRKNSPATDTTELKPARKGPPRLTEVTTSMIPSYDVEAVVSQQLKRIPAAERASATKAGQPLRQYRELAKRFWTAETQTEYLTSQAHAGKAGPVFAEQTLLVRQTWRDWNKAAVYSYKFGPAMQAHFESMQSIASNQQHILEMMPGLLPNNKFRTDKELVSREADVEGGLAGLLPKSPVTGRVYKAPVLTIRL